MPNAVGSRLQIAYIVEVTPGTTPATPTMKALRVKGHTLTLDRGSMQSAELRSDRNLSDFRLGMKSVKGDIDFEWSATTFDDMLEAAMGGTWATNILKVGTTQRYFSIEVGHLDIAQYRLFKGCVVDKLQLSLKPNQIMEAKLSILGMDEVTSGTTAISVLTPAGTASPVDGNSALCVIQENAVTLAIVTSMEFTIDNNAKTLELIGKNTPAGISLGRCIIKGSFTAYVPDLALYNKYAAETATTLSIAVSDGTKSYTFLMSNVKLSQAKVDVQNEDAVMQTIGFTAIYAAADTSAMKITRV